MHAQGLGWCHVEGGEEQVGSVDELLSRGEWDVRLGRGECQKGNLERGASSLMQKLRRAMKESVLPYQMGSMVISKGLYLEPISVVIHDKKPDHQHPHNKEFLKREDKTFKDGAWTTGHHISSVTVTKVQIEKKQNK